jgi:outer membrane protein assembly factor BamD (BamD/ComL family)
MLYTAPACTEPAKPCFVKKPDKVINQQGNSMQKKQNASSKKQKGLVLAPGLNDYDLRKKNLEQQFARNLPTPETARKQYKDKKKKDRHLIKSSEPFWSSITVTDMNYDQLLKRKNELILAGDYVTAIKYIERMFKLTETPEQIIYIMLEWGELLMKVEDYKRAETLFRDFVKLYPGNEYAELAFVKAIESSWYQTSSFERDQSKTEDTLKLIDEFCMRAAIYSHENISRVTQIQTSCFNKLAQSSMGIAKQYIGLSNYRSAHKRLDSLREKDLEKLPVIEPQLLQLEIELARAEQNTTIEQQKLSELKEKFPEHEITLALTTQKSSWLTFA